MMENKKEIYRAGVILGVLTFLVNIIAMPIETLILGIVSMILNFCHRKAYRVKAGMVCTGLGMAMSVIYILFVLYTIKYTGVKCDGYWFFEYLSEM